MAHRRGHGQQAGMMDTYQKYSYPPFFKVRVRQVSDHWFPARQTASISIQPHIDRFFFGTCPGLYPIPCNSAESPSPDTDWRYGTERCFFFLLVYRSVIPSCSNLPPIKLTQASTCFALQYSLSSILICTAFSARFIWWMQSASAHLLLGSDRCCRRRKAWSRSSVMMIREPFAGYIGRAGFGSP